ncbi:MAG TPA: ATP-binding protein [Lacunisphaera sp.]|jgi:signal transduction histidine kinase
MPLDVSSHPFIKLFPKAQAAKLVRQARVKRYLSSELIFDEGASSDSVCLVLDGGISLTKNTPGGSAQIIAHKGPGDYFGELGILDGSTRSAAATASEPTVLGHLPQKAFLAVLAESSWQTVMQLFTQVGENLRASNTRFVTEVVRKEKITLIGEMANSMIHDFRNPFTTIRLVTEALAMIHQDQQTKKLSNVILRQVDRLSGMVEEVLEFARGETRVQIKPVPLREIFSELRENNPAASLPGITFLLKPTDVTLELDRARFQRVLQNLVTNAREAMAQRGKGRIVISARRGKNHCLVSVADNGSGIPEAIRDKLFEPFVSQGKPGGTGLGLALVRSVIEAHRGTITFKTSPRGTIFTLKLPLGS